MSILNYFSHQKSVQYDTIIEDEIHFSDSITRIMRKVGTPKNLEKADTQATLEYKRKLHAFISTAYYCFHQGKLCSVCYQTDALTDDESEHFLSDMKRLIRENQFDGIMNYVCCAKEYWELSDGEVSACICLYTENNKAHIRIDYFD